MKIQLKKQLEHITNINSLLELAWSFQKSKTLHTACELDIFSILGDYEKTAEEVAKEAGTDVNATARLMNALTALGLLNKEGIYYSNTRVTRQYLVKDSPDYIASMAHYSNLYDRWSKLTESVKKGTSMNYRITDDIEGEKLNDFIAAMHWRATNQAREIVNMIYLSNAKKLLDLGGGSGAYAMEFVRAKPDMDVYIFDLPNVIKLTQNYLYENGFMDKIHLIEGDYFVDNIGSDYDIVFLSSIIHSNSIWENIELAKKIYLALKPGGQIIIHDYIISDDRTKPLFTALFSLNMLINTPSGDVYTETDVWVMLKEAWFKNIKNYPTKFGTNLIIASK